MSNKIEILQGSHNVIKEYNEDGKIIHYKRSEGKEYWKTYDEFGHLRSYKDSNGFGIWCLYAKCGKISSYSDTRGNWYHYSYDSDGREIYYRHSSGFTTGKDPT
jgi:YD repeat-containing protein